MNKEVPERNGESKEPSERSTGELRPGEYEAWIESEIAAGRDPCLIQQDDREQEDADP